MAKEETLNNAGTPAEGGEPSTQQHLNQDLKETVIARPAAEPPKTDEEKGKEAEAAKAAAEKAEADKKAEEEKKAAEEKQAQEAKEREEEEKRQKDFDSRLDKHPRFKELTGKNRDLRKANEELRQNQTILQAKIETLEKVRGPEDKGRTRDYVDVSGLSADEIKEKLEDDPKGFLANLTRQIRAEVTEELEGKFAGKIETSLKGLTQEERNRAIGEFYNDFAEKHPDFNELFDSGAIEKLMDEKPYHTPLSAYHELTRAAEAAKVPTEADIQKKIDEAVKTAVATAVKETEQRMITQFKTKGKAMTMGDTGAARVAQAPDEELKDTKKGGGTVAVLTERSLRREQAATGG
jgi:hypothetical protein